MTPCHSCAAGRYRVSARATPPRTRTKLITTPNHESLLIAVSVALDGSGTFAPRFGPRITAIATSNLRIGLAHSRRCEPSREASDEQSQDTEAPEAQPCLCLYHGDDRLVLLH